MSTTKARTPFHFPNMKVRGGKNRKMASWNRTMGAFSRTMQVMGKQADMTARQLLELSREWEKSNFPEDPEVQSPTTKENNYWQMTPLSQSSAICPLTRIFDTRRVVLRWRISRSHPPRAVSTSRVASGRTGTHCSCVRRAGVSSQRTLLVR